MRRGGSIGAPTAGRALLSLAALIVVAGLVAALAQGERTQRGNIIMSLDGGLSPLALPRDRPAPVTVRLDAGLMTTDRSVLPQVRKVELLFPGRGVITTTGLPTCTIRRLRDTTSAGALEACRPALVGRGRLLAQVLLPHQRPFTADARLLAFNGRVDGRRAVILHAVSAHPPTSVILPFVIHLRPGRFTTTLIAHPSRSLGRWPRFARFEVALSRRYSYRGRRLSYLSASCPIPERNTAGYATIAKATFLLADDRRLITEITRSCRAR